MRIADSQTAAGVRIPGLWYMRAGEMSLGSLPLLLEG
jgi:hypothetical protein